MEDEKSKKKRNKKKKNNKQSKALDEVSILGEESVSEDQNQSSSEVAKDSDVSLPGNGFNVTESVTLLESEKQQWLQREAILGETVRQLQTEKDSHIQKEVTLVDTINQLRKENNLHLQKEFTLEEAIKQLRDENNSYNQKEASLDMRIGQLQREKDSWLQKEGQLEAKISQLVDERNTWNLKEVSLEEKIKHLEEEKHSWVLKEDSNKVTIANLHDDVAKLRVQVVELEESRNNLLHENRQLMENISSLQLQIKGIQSSASIQSSDELTKCASERDELNSQVDAAFALVGRLIEENAELVEKVSELLVELDRHGGSAGRPSNLAHEPVTGTAEIVIHSDQESETHEIMPKVGRELNSTEVVPYKEERNSTHAKDNHQADVLLEPSKSEEAGEIVQIPLDENGIRDLELQIAENDENVAVPLTDAPLIGAPFRLISFVSRYVSGADLVDKNSLRV